MMKIPFKLWEKEDKLGFIGCVLFTGLFYLASFIFILTGSINFGILFFMAGLMLTIVTGIGVYLVSTIDL